MEKPAPVQELVVRATGLTGTIVGGGVLVQLEDGVTGLARAGHRMGSVEVLGMGSVLEAGPAQGMVMGLEVVAGMGLEVGAGMVLEVGALLVAGMVLEVVGLMVAGMVLEVAPVILVAVGRGGGSGGGRGGGSGGGFSGYGTPSPSDPQRRTSHG
ncbi:hypothetical protein OIU78_030203 [Salix suchowensis]|nr:hypothetical protein OIU78_030203 [Salix suchowensis]